MRITTTLQVFFISLEEVDMSEVAAELIKDDLLDKNDTKDRPNVILIGAVIGGAVGGVVDILFHIVFEPHLYHWAFEIALLAVFTAIGAYVAHYIEHSLMFIHLSLTTLRKIETDVINNFKTTLSDSVKAFDDKQKSFNKTVSTALQESNIYLVNSKPNTIYVAGVRKSKSDIVHLLGETAHRFVASRDGVMILKVSGIAEYSEVCLALLEMAKKSVWSMSDMGLDLTFMLYCTNGNGLSDGARVRTWINAVNKRVAELDVKRIQVTNFDRTLLPERLKIFEANKTAESACDIINILRPSLRPRLTDAIPFAENLLEGWTNYVKRYKRGEVEEHPKDKQEELHQASPAVNWYVYDESNHSQKLERNSAGCVTGEFIIFDEIYLVRYSSQTHILEVLAGEVVEVFASQFRNESLLVDFTCANDTTATLLANVN